MARYENSDYKFISSARLTSQWGVYFNIYAEVLSQDKESNTSRVLINIYFNGNKTGTSEGYNEAGALPYVTYNVNGNQVTTNTFTWNFTGSGTVYQLLASREFTIGHDASGNANIIFSASLTTNYPYYGVPPVLTVSLNDPLKPIPRKADTYYMNSSTAGDSTATVNISRSGSYNSYRFWINLGNDEWLPYKELTTGKTVSISSSDWAKILANYPKDSTIYVSTLLESLSGGVVAGSDTSPWAVSTVSSATAPTVATPSIGVHVAEMDSTLMGKGLGFIQGISDIKFQMPTTTMYGGAVVSEYKITVRRGNDILYTKTLTSSTNYMTITNFNYYGNITAEFSVKDSRGTWSAIRSLNFTVNQYTKPEITNLVKTRTNASGQQDIKGTNVKLEFTIKVISLKSGGVETNSIKYTILDITNSSTGTVKTTATINGISALSRTYTLTGYLPTAKSKIRLRVEDAYATTDMDFDLSTGGAALTLGGAKGIGAGGMYDMSDILGVALQTFGSAHFKESVTFDKQVTFAVPPIGVGSTAPPANDGITISRSFTSTGGYIKFSTGEVIQWLIKDVDLSNSPAYSYVDTVMGAWKTNMTSCYFYMPTFFNDNNKAMLELGHWGATASVGGTIRMYSENEVGGKFKVAILAIGIEI